MTTTTKTEQRTENATPEAAEKLTAVYADADPRRGYGSVYGGTAASDTRTPGIRCDDPGSLCDDPDSLLAE